MSTGGAANNFKILWSDAQYAVTQAPTVSDFSVSVGSIALLDFATIFANENLIQFNVVTGAEPGRIVSVVLHTANGDYKLSLTLENGEYKSFTEEAVTCNHNA